MAISRQKKEQLIDQYVADLSSASNIVVVRQKGIGVNTANAVRKDVKGANGTYTVARKRLLLRAVQQAGLQDINLQDLDGSIVVITANSDNEFGPLKAVNTVLKDLKKKDTENTGTGFSFLGGRFDKERKAADYVIELANLPSKEELIAKLLFMLKHPMQSLASVVDQIAKKGGSEAAADPVESAPEQKAPVESTEHTTDESAPMEQTQESEASSQESGAMNADDQAVAPEDKNQEAEVTS